jgi:hypothetical protein
MEVLWGWNSRVGMLLPTAVIVVPKTIERERRDSNKQVVQEPERVWEFAPSVGLETLVRSPAKP